MRNLLFNPSGSGETPQSGDQHVPAKYTPRLEELQVRIGATVVDAPFVNEIKGLPGSALTGRHNEPPVRYE